MVLGFLMVLGYLDHLGSVTKPLPCTDLPALPQADVSLSHNPLPPPTPHEVQAGPKCSQLLSPQGNL